MFIANFHAPSWGLDITYNIHILYNNQNYQFFSWYLILSLGFPKSLIQHPTDSSPLETPDVKHAFASARHPHRKAPKLVDPALGGWIFQSGSFSSWWLNQPWEDAAQPHTAQRSQVTSGKRSRTLPCPMATWLRCLLSQELKMLIEPEAHSRPFVDKPHVNALAKTPNWKQSPWRAERAICKAVCAMKESLGAESSSFRQCLCSLLIRQPCCSSITQLRITCLSCQPMSRPKNPAELYPMGLLKHSRIRDWQKSAQCKIELKANTTEAGCRATWSQAPRSQAPLLKPLSSAYWRNTCSPGERPHTSSQTKQRPIARTKQTVKSTFACST